MRPGPIGGSFADNPFGVSGLANYEALWTIGIALIFGALLFAVLLALIAVIARLRRAQGVERAQLKWFVVANVVLGVLLVLGTVDGGTNSTFFDVLGPFSLSLQPIAVGIAILRYRLFEIDRIISRTLSWAIVTGLLVAAFGGVEVGLQAVLAGFTQGQTLAVAGSTLVVAALFQPLRRKVQTAIDRRFDRARLDGQRTQDVFADQMRAGVDLDRLRSALVATANSAVRPTGASLWLRTGDPTTGSTGFWGGGQDLLRDPPKIS